MWLDLNVFFSVLAISFLTISLIYYLPRGYWTTRILLRRSRWWGFIGEVRRLIRRRKLQVTSDFRWEWGVSEEYTNQRHLGESN